MTSGDTDHRQRRHQYDTPTRRRARDTVGDLINAINSGTAGNATSPPRSAAADLVLTGHNDTASITVGGTGATDAADLGFGAANNTFTADQSADARR